MSNQKEHNRINQRKLFKLLGGLAAICLVSLIFILIWDTQLPGVRIHPNLKPLTLIVIRVAGIPAFVTYLGWFLVLWGLRSSSNTPYKSALWTCVVLVLTAILQLVLTMLYGVMGTMAVILALSTLSLSLVSGLCFFLLRP